MLDFADLVALNKMEKKGAEDALRNVRKQYRRNRNLFDIARRGAAGFRHHRQQVQRPRHQHSLPGTDRPAQRQEGARLAIEPAGRPPRQSRQHQIIPPEQAGYLGEIVRHCPQLPQANRRTDHWPRADSSSSRGPANSWRRRAQGWQPSSMPPLPPSRPSSPPRPVELLQEWPELQQSLPPGADGHQGARQGDPHRTVHHHPLRDTNPPGLPARLRGLTARSSTGRMKENLPRAFPLHRRAVPLQAHRRGPEAPVRRRRAAGADQPPLSLSDRGRCGQAPFDRLRQRHPLWRGPG